MGWSIEKGIHASRVICAFFGLLVLPACGGGGGGSEVISSGSASLTLVSSDPADSAIDVSRAIAPTLLFSSAIDSPSANSSVLLRKDNDLLETPAVVSVSDSTVMLTPESTLLPLTTYNLTTTTGLTDINGETLNSAVNISFTTRDGSWQSAELIESNNDGSVARPQIAADGEGNALAVWYQSDGGNINIWANRYSAGSGWGTAGLIETDNAGLADNPQIGADAEGNALAVWVQSDGAVFSIWSNRYDVNLGWGNREVIETDNTGYAINPQIAVNQDGEAIAVWVQSDGMRQNIWANRYVVGFGWATAELIETDDDGSASYPQIAFDSDGNALAVWVQSDGTRDNILSNRYVVGDGWGVAETIETDDSGSGSFPQIAFDGSGSALTVWSRQADGEFIFDVWANRYDSVLGWGAAGQINDENIDGSIGNPEIAVDEDGNALAVWNQSDGTRFNIWAKRYEMDMGWGDQELIETDNAGHAFVPKIAFDKGGNALAVWYQNDGDHFNIWANRYVMGSGWGAAELIETGDDGDAADPQVVFDSSGNGVAVWSQSDGTRTNVFSNRFE